MRERKGDKTMTMQRRHFELIAETLKASKPARDPMSPKYDMWRSIVSEFCGRLSTTNGQFNKARFLRACGVEG